MPEEKLATITFKNPALYTGLTGVVDPENAVIKGVSLITGDMTAEGHDLYVDATTLKQLHALASKMKQVPVTLDHGGGITSINGYVDNHRLDGNKLRGDWHLLRSHKETETMLERAERQPSTFGMSVAFKGPPKGVLHMGKKCARAERLLSVDCVTRAAANPEGMFSVRDDDSVDKGKKVMPEPTQTQNTATTLEDVLAAVGKISSRLDQIEGVQDQLVDHVNQSVENREVGDPAEILEALFNASDDELAAYNKDNGTAITRAEIDTAVAEYNASVEAGATDTDTEGAAATGAEGGAAGAEMAGAGAGAAATGAAAQSTPATFAALQREVIALRTKINAGERKAALKVEEMQFQEVENKITVLSTQRNEAIELAEQLVAENEALRLANRTGVRPVKPGVDRDKRLFSAGDDGELHEFQVHVKAVMAEKKITEGAAILLAVKEKPELHADWLQKQGTQTIRA